MSGHYLSDDFLRETGKKGLRRGERRKGGRNSPEMSKDDFLDHLLLSLSQGRVGKREKEPVEWKKRRPVRKKGTMKCGDLNFLPPLFNNKK